MVNQMMNKKMKTDRKGMVWMAAGLLLVVAALVLTGKNLWDERRANIHAKNVLEQLSDITHITEQTQAPIDTSMPGVVVPDYILNPDMEMPTVTINGYEYIGVLTVPALELSLPVMSDWSYPKLKIAPNRFDGSAYTDNLIIAGHNYRSHFGGLKALRNGDEVTFTDTDGNQFTYTVAEIEILKAEETERMKSGDWALTFFTCTLGGENRITVRCEKE